MRLRKILPAIVVLLAWGNTTALGQYYFGRNKIQYNNFNWQVMKTPHFDIYFYPEMKELAEIGATFAEESYKILEDKFNHSINSKIPLIFYSSHTHFQQTNVIPYLIPEGVGGFFEFLKGRVVIPCNGSIPQFKQVIRHELVHVFMHSKINRIMKNHKKLTWRSPPLWFTEGLAEFWSRGWDSQAEMVIRDAVLNGYLVPLSQMYQIQGSFLMYKEGQAILKYIAEVYGKEKILQLIENMWKEDKFEHVLKLTIGQNYKQFDEKWIYYLKKNKYPLLKEGNSPRMVSQRISEKGINTKPAFYRDGEGPKVVFVSNRVGYSNIYRKPLVAYSRKEKPEVLIKGERTSEFEAFHPLRSKIDVNSQGILTFVSKSGEKDIIYTYDIAQKNILSCYGFDDLVSISSPSWAPDGQRIAFSGINFAGKSDLYILDTKNGRLQKLTNDFYDDRDPAWSHDGEIIVFSSDRSDYGLEGFYNLFLFKIKTGEIQYLTFGRHNDYAPVWSPDGKYIAFTSDQDESFNIWVLKGGIRKSYRTQFASTASMNASAADNPKGETLETYFTRFDLAEGEQELIEPPQLKKITNFTTGAFDPEWTDDGALLFTGFENFGFQLEKLDKIEERFNKAEVATINHIKWKGPLWKIEGCGAKFVSKTIKYKNKFALDFAQSQVAHDPIFGTSGGAQLAVTDVLGNHQYYFLIYNNARTRDEFLESFNIAITKVDLSRRTNLAVGVYHFAGRFFNYYEGFFFERWYGGFGAVSYPLSTFKRLEGSVNFRSSDKEWYGIRRIKALLLSNFFSLIKDNSLWGPTGPIDGERFNFTLGNTVDVQRSNVNFFTLIADYRRYFRLSTRITYALRLMGCFNQGKEAFPFVMGGSWDLRGYKRWSLWGEKLLLLNNEIRFPFIDNFTIQFPFGSLGLNAIRGATFVDLGNAWSGTFRELLGSFGFGIRFRIGGILVLRFDYGKLFTMGFNTPPFDISYFHVHRGTFKQFFFGWDF